jgi:hypothetical protein
MSGLEVISGIREDVYRFPVNPAAFYIRDLSMCGFFVPTEVLEPIP